MLLLKIMPLTKPMAGKHAAQKIGKTVSLAG